MLLKLLLRLLKAAFSGRFKQHREEHYAETRIKNNIRFEVRGQPVQLLVDFAGTYTVELRWINHHDRFDLRLKEFATRGIRRRGMEKTDLADAALDQRFLVYTNFKSSVDQLLFDRQTKKALEDIIQFFEMSEFQVLINKGKFVVKKRFSQDLERQTAELVRLAISLRNFMVNSIQDAQVFDESAMEDGSITFVNVVDSSDEPLVDTECQVCGQELDMDLVSCISCKTLHHRDCWEYNGCCTTFGCRQNQYEKVG